MKAQRGKGGSKRCVEGFQVHFSNKEGLREVSEVHQSESTYQGLPEIYHMRRYFSIH